MNCPSCGISIDQHPANRCLDACVAEKVMGLRVCRDYGFQGNHDLVIGEIPRYSTTIKGAWALADELRERGLHLQMNDTMSAYRARFFTVDSTTDWDRESADGAYYQFADTAPLAICLASLKAAGES